jgi:hypothetical protein
MALQSIWENNRIGDPTFLGLTLGGQIEYTSSDSFVKADYPGLRAIRVGEEQPVLTVDLPDSYPIDPGTAGSVPQPSQAVEATDQTVSSTTFAAGSPACGLAFTAPASGNVWVGWYGFLTMAISTASQKRVALGWELRTGSTIGSGTVITAAEDVTRVVSFASSDIDAGLQMSAGARYLVTGLTPDDPYNVRTMHKLSSTSGVTSSVLERVINVDPVLSGEGSSGGSVLVELWY